MSKVCIFPYLVTLTYKSIIYKLIFYTIETMANGEEQKKGGGQRQGPKKDGEHDGNEG